MNKNKVYQLFAAVCIAFACQASSAVPIYLDYTFDSGDVMTAEFVGELLDDGDTVAITQGVSLEFQGYVLDTSDYLVITWDEAAAITGGAPYLLPSTTGFLSISGTFMDYFMCDRDTCTLGFLADSSDAPNSLNGVIVNTNNFDTFTDDFSIDLDAWNLTVGSSAVSEPATLGLVGAGVLLLGLARRRRSI